MTTPERVSRPAVRLRPIQIFVAALVALPMTELGHFFIYAARYGDQAFTGLSLGPHAYFPSVLKASGVVLALGILLALTLIGLLRSIAGRRRRLALTPGWSLLPLFLTLAGVQVVTYVCQEILEALAVGAATPDLLNLGAQALAGQVPLAFIAAVILNAASSRLKAAVLAAVAEIRRQAKDFQRFQRPSLTALPRHNGFVLVGLYQSAPAIFVKRGPPAAS